MIDSKSGNPNIWVVAAVIITSTAWSSSSVADFPRVGTTINGAMQRFDTQSGLVSRPSVTPNRISSGSVQSTRRSISMPSNRGGSGLSISGYRTSSGSRDSYSRNNYSNNRASSYSNRYSRNYSNNYGYVSGRNYNSRNSRYYSNRHSNSGAYFAGGLLLGAWLGSYNRYEPHYYGRYSNRYSNRGYYGGYNNRYYNYGYPSSSVRYYQSAPVESTIIYREKIVSDATARDDREAHLLRDLDGNCFEVSYSAGGQELRLQVPPETCEW